MTPQLRQGRSVVLVNAVVAIGIITAIAGVSVFREPSAPPSIAEFAPANPARLLTAEPSPLPANGGSTRPAGPMPTPTGAQGVPSALQCWSWPDGSTTQTFDRQSPPCISAWNVAAGNGGATSHGVTRTEIRVGVPAESISDWQPYAEFFSRHYQLYGRVLRLVPLGVHDLSTGEGQRAAGAAAAEQRVFAALDDPRADATPPDPGIYLDTLARARLVGVVTGATQLSTTALSAQAPYAWSHQPTMDSTQRMVAAAACRELSGRRAVHSKQLKGQNRRFAVLVPGPRANAGRSFDTSALLAGLERCHVEAAVQEYDPHSPGALEGTLAEERRKATTTLIPFAGADVVATTLMPAAERIGYAPEWLLPAFVGAPEVATWSRAPKDQVRALFGVAAWSRPLPEPLTPAAQALREVARSAVYGRDDEAIYRGLSVIAAGAQLAGPRLTPQSFADGLESTDFGNPGAGAPPVYQARVGFADVDHSMVDDFAQVWWHGSGFCLIGNGRRWTPDELKYEDPGFFDRDAGC